MIGKSKVRKSFLGTLQNGTEDMMTNFGVESEITLASVACVAHQVRIAAPPCCSSSDVPNHPVFPCRIDIERAVRSSAALAGQGMVLLADAAFFYHNATRTSSHSW